MRQEVKPVVFVQRQHDFAVAVALKVVFLA